MRNLYILTALLGSLALAEHHSLHDELARQDRHWNAMKPVKEPIYPKTFKKGKVSEKSLQ